MTGVIRPLDLLIRECMNEYGDFKDYDDANMIGVYNKMSQLEKEAVDRVFAYLCGLTFEGIINKYEKQ